MPNSRRFNVAAIPQHVVQRGNDRQACFRQEDDYLEYLARLAGASRKHGVAIHAYVLMTNHVHLLATPETGDGMSRLMQAVGSGYVRSYNAKHARTGTLWEGRFFSSLVDGDDYLWQCHRYIELNPVRAGIASDPSRYRWSSFARNALGKPDRVVTPHPAYAGLAACEPFRIYRGFFESTLSEATIVEIRDRWRKGRAFASEERLQHIEAVASRSPRSRGPGRPRSAAKRELTISDLFSQ